MAEISARIKPKKSSAAGEVPQAADLEVAEIAVNTADGKIFVKHTDNTIKEISGASGSGGAVSSVNGKVGPVILDIEDLENVGLLGGGAADADFDNVQLLLHGEGVNGGTVIRNSSKLELGLPSLTATTTSSTAFKFGYSSLRLVSGSIEYIHNENFNLLNNNFTLETWLRTDTVANDFGIFSFGQNATNYIWDFYWSQTSGGAIFDWTTDGTSGTSSSLTYTWTPTINTWYHVALVRNGNDLVLYIDGSAISTQSITDTIFNSDSAILKVGAKPDATAKLEGYLDEVRITNGVARYTTAFTAPTAAFLEDGSIQPTDRQGLIWDDVNNRWQPGQLANETGNLDDVVNTSVNDATIALLGEGTNGGTVITDDSVNQLSPSVVTNVTTSTAQFKYGSSSLFFNNGKLEYPDSAITRIGQNTTKFTIEFWYYTTNNTSRTFVYKSGQFPPNGTFYFDYQAGNQYLRLVCSFDGTNTESIRHSWVPTLSTWYHIALVRDGRKVTLFIDGIAVFSNGNALSSAGPLYGATSNPLSLFIGGNSVSTTSDTYYDEFIISDGTAKYTENFTPSQTAIGPTDNKILAYDSTNNYYKPVNPLGVTTVNGQEGSAVINVEDLNNYKTSSAPATTIYRYPEDTVTLQIPAPGKYKSQSSQFIYVFATDADGKEFWKIDPIIGESFDVSYDQVTWWTRTLNAVNNLGSYYELGTSTCWEEDCGSSPFAVSGTIYLRHTESSPDPYPIAATDGQALLWDNANSQWEPGDVAGNTDLTYTASTRLLESSTGTDVTLPEVVASGDSGLMTGTDKAKLDGITAGAEPNVATDLTYTASTRLLASSTGTDVTLPEVVASGDSGLITGADKAKLDGITAGAEPNVATDLTYTASTRVLASSTGTDATLPEVVAAGDSGLMTGADKTKLNGIETGAQVNVATDLTYTASTRLLASSTGTDATLPEVVASGDSGLITGADKAKLDGISPGAEVNAVDSVAGKTGAVTLVKADITDFSDADYATAAQGTLADSATQPGDNVSTLVNDAGYLTDVEIVVSSTAPGSPNQGLLWYDLEDARTFVYTGTEWADASPDAGNPVVITSDSAPSNPQDGDLWYRSTDGRMYVYYDDGTTSQWVDANPSISSSDWTRTGTTISPTQAGDSLAIDGDLQMASQNSGPLSGFRNALINGDFRVWARGNNIDLSAATGVTYHADRWAIAVSVSAGSRSQQSGLATTQSNGVTSSVDITDLSSITQYIELSRPNINGQFPIGSVWTQSFYTDQDIEGDAANNVRFRISTGSTGYSSNFITAADVTGVTWEKGPGADKGTLKHYYCTFTISGDASAGVGNGADVVSLGLTFPCNASGTTKLTYCQLEPGPVATPFEHRSYGTELALCQRYYQELDVRRTSQSEYYTYLVKPRVTPTDLSGIAAIVYADSFGVSSGTTGKVTVEFDAEL